MQSLVVVGWALALLTFTTHGQNPAVLRAQPASYPAPKFGADSREFGRGIQRTMSLLATSTPEKRNTVRILFYGQSITEQKWWKAVADDLRFRFPNADLIIENRALGGFAAQLLVKTAETDLYPFYPDLLIFHVYGSYTDYENIIKRARERTTTEILLQTDHVTSDADLAEETNPAALTPKNWSAWMNNAFLPAVAAKYGAELVDQHGAWKRYLQENHLPAAKLLSDNVHLNDHGCYVMSELVKAHLRYLPGLPTHAWKDLVRTYNIGSDVEWHDGTLTLELDGNRIDLIATDGGGCPPASITIDGKKPSEFPELYKPTRTTAYPGSKWPCLLRLNSQMPPALEEWTLTLRDVSPDLKDFHFDLAGSVTGPDGEGRGDQPFASASGRVLIDPADWNLQYGLRVFTHPLQPGFQVQWKVEPFFADVFVPPTRKSPGVERVVTIAQGLPTGNHILRITGNPQVPLAGVRVYRPPVR